MKRLVIKTAVITLAAIIALIAAAYGLLCLFSPKVIAEMYKDLGNKNLATHYYAMQYDKKQDFSALITLCENVDECSDSARAKDYVKLLVEDKAFNEYCHSLDSLASGGFTTAEYFYAKYALATYLVDGIDGGLLVCQNYLNAYGYTKNNPWFMLLTDARLTFTAEDLGKISAFVLQSPSEYALRDNGIVLQLLNK